MFRVFRLSRAYCKLASKDDLLKSLRKIDRTDNIDFQCLNHPSKVPAEAISNITQSAIQSQNNEFEKETEIDSKTIQLLERLSLVDLDSRAALQTLKSSIQFADKIVNIDTENVPPLYSVLEQENLELREDIVTEGDCRVEILKNAKVIDEDYFVSPPGNIPLEQEEKKFEN